jgi:2-polyprenyl-3-methyl-5-hydroxy-6-metoxy-1,4-benzoquinol methylase
MSESDVVSAYDAWHEELATSEGSAPKAMTPWHTLTLRHLPADVTGMRVLEIGCGRGAFAALLAQKGADVTAADFSPAAVKHATRLAGHFGATVLEADIQELPFADQAFDVVVSQETLEHVPDPDRGLEELVRVTKVGGLVIVTTPNYFSIIGLFRVALRLIGRRYTEMGQPINQPLLLHSRVKKLRKLGCTVQAVDASHMLLPVPGFRTVRLGFMERPHRAMKWFCFNSLTAATRDQ